MTTEVERWASLIPGPRFSLPRNGDPYRFFFTFRSDNQVVFRTSDFSFEGCPSVCEFRSASRKIKPSMTVFSYDWFYGLVDYRVYKLMWSPRTISFRNSTYLLRYEINHNEPLAVVPLDYRPKQRPRKYETAGSLVLPITHGRPPTRLSGYFLNGAMEYFAKQKLRRGRSIRFGKGIPQVKKDTIGPEVRYTTFGKATIDFFHNVIIGSTTEQKETFYRSAVSVRTPGFKKMSKTKLPVNPYSLDLRKTFEGIGTSRFRGLSPAIPETDTMQSASTSSLFLDVSNAAPVHNAQVTNMALKRLVEHAQLDVSNVAETVATFDRTIKMIGSTAGRIAGSLAALKRRDLGVAYSNLLGTTNRQYIVDGGKFNQKRSVSENWLALQYGWKPLLQDIDGSMRALASFVKSTDIVRYVRGSAKTTLVTKDPIMFDFISLNSVAPYKISDLERTIDSRSYVVLRYKIDNHLQSFLAQTGFTNPVSLAWELLPYSFVFDWFLPIGPYLESFSNFDGLQFVDGSISKFTKETSSAYFNDLVVKGNSTYKWLIDNRGSYSQEKVRFDRVKLTTFPRQTLPTFKNPLSVVHSLNALALLQAHR